MRRDKHGQTRRHGHERRRAANHVTVSDAGRTTTISDRRAFQLRKVTTEHSPDWCTWKAECERRQHAPAVVAHAADADALRCVEALRITPRAYVTHGNSSSKRVE